MRTAISAALLCLSSVSFAQTVEIASGDWSEIPHIQPLGKIAMSHEAVMKADQLLGPKGPCKLGKSNVMFRVPFLLKFSPEKQVQRIVLRRLGCSELESLMGGVVRDLARAGEFAPTGENEANWYQSELSFLIQ